MIGTVPEDRVRIFDKAGFPLAEFRTQVQRSWTLAGEGRAQFTVPTNNANVVTEKNLEFGNYLLVENSILPSWVGVLDTPRSWASKAVTVSAYTMERVFSWRIGVMEALYKTNPAGIFAQLIRFVNTGQVTLLRVGNLEAYGIHQLTIHPEPLSGYLSELVKRTRQEYMFRPYFTTQGNLLIAADWRRYFGTYYNVDLLEGEGGGNIEVSSNIMVEDGKIINSILGYGVGETWASKPSSTYTDALSVAQYGLRASGREYRASANVAFSAMRGQVNRERKPIKRFSVTALNVGDTYKYINVGNGLNFKLESAGFYNGVVGYNGRVRIRGMSYDPATPNKIKLVLEGI